MELEYDEFVAKRNDFKLTIGITKKSIRNMKSFGNVHYWAMSNESQRSQLRWWGKQKEIPLCNWHKNSNLIIQKNPHTI
jgi:hypothetical protein